MSPPTVEDFSDLDEIISAQEARRAARGGIALKRHRLTNAHNMRIPERELLQAEVDQYDRMFVWETTACVALFDVQTCAACGHRHRFFRGWFESQQHRSDSNCHRLVRGKSADISLPRRIEEHQQGACEMCDDCAESCLVIDQFLESACAPPS